MQESNGAYQTGEYANLFVDLLDKSPADVQVKVDEAWHQLFYGDDATERVYYPVEPDMAYIKTIAANDVRSEGMSYGMMIAVQLDKKEEFDRLWKWAKTFMQHRDGSRQGYFSWRNSTDGAMLDVNPAPDGEEWIVMALFFASARWGDGSGILNYRAEAQSILDAMLSKADVSDSDTTIANMFDRSAKQVVFVPVGNAATFTDPSYHVPHFYELWARWSNTNNNYWRAAADTSRQFLKRTVHPKTGLAPDYALFDGSPTNPYWTTGHDDFRFDAWRVAMNTAVDYIWFKKDDWAIEQSNRLLDFFYHQGLTTYGNQFTLDGKPLSSTHSPGLIAMNAVAALTSTHPKRAEFVRAVWDTPLLTGSYRYYDGLLQMLALLQLSGHFKIYHLED